MNKDIPPKYDRRVFLKRMAAAVAGLFVGFTADRLLHQSAVPEEQPNIPDEEELVEPEPESEAAFLSDQEVEISLESFGLRHTPDGRIPYITLANGRRRYFISANNGSYLFEAAGESDLVTSLRSASKENFHQVTGPDQNLAYRNGYSALTSIIQPDTANKDHCVAFSHNEQRTSAEESGTFTATVGLFESSDAGQTWMDKGVVITGEDTLEPGQRVSGAGQPCAIIKDNFVYVYYIDWASQQKSQRADQIYVARAPLGDNGSFGQFEKLTTQGFSQDDERLQPVIRPPAGIPDSSYAALPSVSFNLHLQRYICVFETNVGFCLTTSSDGIMWDEAKNIFTFPQSQANRQDGDVWYGYPTLLSDSTQPQDGMTDETGTLVYSKGRWGQDAHQLVTRSFHFP